MKRLHVVSDRSPANGMFVVAGLLARENGDRILTCPEFLGLRSLADIDEVVVHGCWLPCYWRACLKVLRRSPRTRLVRMPHGALDPVRLAYGRWKKLVASPIEKHLFAHSDRILVTCEAEAEWVEIFCGRRVHIELIDLRRFFDLTPKTDGEGQTFAVRSRPLHVLYLGRRHPLKGVRYLERAVEEINAAGGSAIAQPAGDDLRAPRVELRIVSDHFGDELEEDWKWCDVLCLPTLSENFGLVVAEALARGKRVITTDGAPAWEDFGSAMLTYLRGYRDGTERHRVEMLKTALSAIGSSAHLDSRRAP